jgi:regulator of sigma E protease
MLDYALNISLLALGFGFVIFWHELGHFLAAKYVGIKVEQFAVGFGNALLAWRKGVGVRVGTTRPEYEKRIKEHLATKAAKDSSAELSSDTNLSTEQIDAASKELGLGETEYRLNWIPLGGYVKMLGQDDMNPNAVSADPRAYPQKSVGARMLVISAGVIMNIILAAALFMILFTMGHRVPPAVIGGLIAGSPAQRVTHVVDGKTVVRSLEVGDQILELDGTKQDDWTKVGLTAALADASEPTSIAIRHVDGKTATYLIAPEKDPVGRGGGRGFLQLGVEQPRSLQGPDPKKAKLNESEEELRALYPEDFFAIKPGDKIIGVDGQTLNPEDPKDGGINDYYKLDRAVQAAGRAGGRPVELTVQREGGAIEKIVATPRISPAFGKEPLNFAGMLPRTTVGAIQADTGTFRKRPVPAKKVLKPGDVVVRIVSANDPVNDPTFDELTKTLNRAANGGNHIEMTVLRDEQPQTVTIKEFKKVDEDRYGLGFSPGYDTAHAVVAGTLEDSPAAKAGIPSGATITSVNGTAVKNWFEIQRIIAESPLGQPLQITATKDDKPATFQLTLAESHRDAARNARYLIAPVLALVEQNMVRQAKNPLQAAWWGVTETRDFILQFYVTIRRMFDGSVSYTNLMGPLGIFSAGTQFAFKGMDWLIWFLAMISANLAVVNFLPIPVVDGGHFVFLLMEKVQGKPVSQRMQSIAQVVGLALLLGVFLLVTYQDISRMVSTY